MSAHIKNDSEHLRKQEKIDDTYASRYTSISAFLHEKDAIWQLLVEKQVVNIKTRVQNLRRSVQHKIRE